jgi:transglutaminase-like putative cysteine protease
MTIFRVRHITEYRYRRPVRFGEHRIMFRPRDSYDQRLLSDSLLVTPLPQGVTWSHDVFGNCVAHVAIQQASKELRFETVITLDHFPQDTPAFVTDERAMLHPFSYEDEELPDLRSSMQRQFVDDGGEIERWAGQFRGTGSSIETGRLLMTLCYAIKESFAYERRSAHGTQPPLITLQSRRGTCRDFALLMMEAVRSLGFAARFVSGYIYVPSRDGVLNLGGGSTHAWCQVYLPGAGWVEFDPTNGIVGNRDLIRAAVTRDPRQAVPLSGTFFGHPSDDLGMNVQVNVTTEESAAWASPAEQLRSPRVAGKPR